MTSEEKEKQPSWASKWKSASARWARETSLVYFSNPAARRDFRVQFRGNRSAWLFTSFLVILGGIALVEYWRISVNNPSIESAQNALYEFYQVVLACLGVAVALVAPALSATAIVAEKQRRSLDLVFSSPLRPQSYLVGKIIANYRYIWIMLALSLPVTAMCVMLGGASWTDVIEAYFLLSIQGVVFTSIGLFFSAITERAISAVIYTYVGVTAYLGLTAMLAAIGGSWENGPMATMSMFGALNPFMLLQSVGSYTTILGLNVPNVLLATATSTVIVRMLILGAGSFLVAPKPIERAKLRYTIIGTMAVLAGYLVNTSPLSHNPSQSAQELGMLLFLATLPLVAFMPFLTCYGFDGENRFLPNGLFKWQPRFAGTPASALPCILLTVAAGSIGLSIGAAGTFTLGVFIPYVLYVAGFWTFFWSMGRLASSYLTGLKVARLLQFVSFAGVIGVPLLFLSWFASNNMNSDSAIWLLHPLYPIFDTNSRYVGATIVYALLFFGSSIGVTYWAEANLRARLARRTLKKMEKSMQATQASAI